MTGRALTASELAHQAGITPQTASSHLAKLEAGGLIEPEKQGVTATTASPAPTSPMCSKGWRASPSAPAIPACAPGRRSRRCAAARICYDHLAGDLGVQMLDSMRRQRLVRQTKQDIELTGEGRRFMAEALQIDTDGAGAPASSGVQGLPRLERTPPSPRRHARAPP